MAGAVEGCRAGVTEYLPRAVWIARAGLPCQPAGDKVEGKAWNLILPVIG
jgi:hypothetical protein